MNGSHSNVWEQKMKQTKCALKNWIKLPFLTPMSVRKDRVAELSVLQVELENKEVTFSHIALHQIAQLKTNISFKQEEEYLRLKSRTFG